MAWVVFLRGVNVGGRKRYKPSRLADDLDDLEVTNIGAAGTYVVRGTDDPTVVRDQVEEALPFETQVFVSPGNQILELLEEDPLDLAALPEGTKAYVTVLSQAPAQVPKMPLDRPDGEDWQLRLAQVRDASILSLRRPGTAGHWYPNGVVEDVFGMPATTRGWATVERIGRVLREG